MSQGEIRQAVGQRGQSAAGMDQDRHLGFFGQLEDIVKLPAVEGEILRPGVELDPSCPGVEAPFGLRQRPFGRVEAGEGDQAPLAFAGPGQNAVVGEAVGGLALGVMQREHAGPPCLGGIELAQQLLERQRAAVLVEAEVGVGVDDFGVGRAQTGRLGEKWGEGCGVEGVVHRTHPIVSSWLGRW